MRDAGFVAARACQLPFELRQNVIDVDRHVVRTLS